jgi:predicted DNA-binding transcriptional regulator YafY
MTTQPATFTVNEVIVKDIVDLAIKHKKQIKIAYLDQKGNAESRVMEPFDSTNEKNFGGHCHLRSQYRNFSYNRVVRIVLMDTDQQITPPEKKTEN